jgi:hypothetical protein
VRTRLVVATFMVLVAAAVAAVVIGGGGGEKKASRPAIADPLAEALGYVDPRAPLVAVVQTDPSRGQGAALAGLVSRFAGADIGLGLLLESIGASGLTWEEDIRPQLGNPVAFAVDPETRTFTAAFVARDETGLAGTMARLVDGGDLRAGLRLGETGTYTGASFALGVTGPVVAIASDEARLRDALERRRRRAGLTRPGFDRRASGVPRDAFARIAADAPVLAGQLIGKAASAHPYARALGSVGLGVRIEDGGVRFLLRGRAEADELVSSDVPLAPGPASPRPAPGEDGLAVGVRDLSHTLAVLERALADDERFKTFDEVRDALRRFARIDLDAIALQQLKGTTTISGDGETLTFRGELRDGKPLRDVLPRLAGVSGLAFEAAGPGEYELDSGASDTYVLSRDGEPVVAFGVVGDVLVVSTDPSVDIAGVAARKPGAAPAKPGALAGRLEGEALRTTIVSRLHLPSAASIVLGPLEDLVFRLQADVDGLDGEAFLRVGD